MAGSKEQGGQFQGEAKAENGNYYLFLCIHRLKPITGM